MGIPPARSQPTTAEDGAALVDYIRDRQQDPDGSGEWLPFALYCYTLDVIALARAEEDALAEAVAQKVFEKMQAAPVVAKPEPILVNMAEAARLLGITYNALRKRVAKHTFKPAKAIVRNGDRIEFNREILRGGAK